MMIMATGMGLTMAPATESIMGSLPRAKAGVGSAVNDTTRQVGGALGVAIIGSIMSSIYGARIVEVFGRFGIAGSALAKAKEGLGQALGVATDPRLPLPASARHEIVAGAKEAFTAGLHRGVLVAAAAALLGALAAARWLPATAPAEAEAYAPEPVLEPAEAALAIETS
jgi:hypothetical protein